MHIRRITVTPALVATTLLWIGQMLPLKAQTSVAGESGSHPVEVTVLEGTTHFATGKHLIHSATGELSFVRLKIVVAPDGTVKSASPVQGNPAWYQRATALASAWHFEPFERQGTAIYAVVFGTIDIVPPEQRSSQRAPFPEVKDWDSLRITLERSTCMGTCPAYKLTVLGNGTVVYKGETFVDYCGEYRGHVSPEVVRELVDLFKSADYFSLLDRYDARASDVPTYITSIAFDDKAKSVLDEMGVFAGRPEIVAAVEDGIDRLAGPKVWAREIETHTGCWGRPPIKISDFPSRID